MVAPIVTSQPLLGSVIEDTSISTAGVVTAFDPEGDLPLLWSIVGATTIGANFSYAMTSLRVVKNGATIVFDDFADGAPPPAAPPGFPNNTYGTQGTLTESNGSLILSSTGAVPIGAPGTPDPFVGVGAFLRTNIDPANLTQGLKSNSSFSVEARYLLSSLPDAPREAFSLSLADRLIGGTGTPPDQPGDDVVELRVVQLNSGVLAVRLIDRNFATDQATTLETINLNAPAGADEIALRLSHNVATVGVVTASFDFLQAGTVVGTQVFATTGRIFGTDTATTADDENWTRVLINATAPQTSDSSLVGTYGTLSIDQNGSWTYQLGAGGVAIATAVQALRQGQTVEDLFTLRVSDGALASTQTATVQVTGINDAPTDIALAGNTVAEGATLGAVVSILSSTDPDNGDAAAFTLLNNAGGRFAIANGNQLVVANGALLDFETATSHQITVRVTDGFGGFRDESFTINVSNVDESAPLPFVGGDEPNDFLGTAGPDGMLGGGGNDTLRGGEGNDVLDGGIGDDSMIGGDGPDVYFVNSVNDVVEEGPEPGVYDTVWSTVSYTLPANVEIFIAQGGAGDINGTGNDDVTLMLGNEGNNRLSSLGGNDIVLGLSGNDTIEGGAGFLDVLVGGIGADVLTGGPGHDFFAFQFVQEAGDVITDFNTTPGSDLDILDLRPLWESFTNFGSDLILDDAITLGHFRFVQSGTSTQVFADRDSGEGSEPEVLLVTILNTNAAAVQGLTLIV